MAVPPPGGRESGSAIATQTDGRGKYVRKKEGKKHVMMAMMAQGKTNTEILAEINCTLGYVQTVRKEWGGGA